jgi:predicted protein tyrosine phosphatase
MTILVCPLSKVPLVVAARRPGRVVSILDPGFSFPELGPGYSSTHLRLRFHDIHVATENQVMPSADQVSELLRFLGEWDGARCLLVHCRAGIGRSTATAFIAACLHNPSVDEREIAVRLRRVAPLARPNQVLVGLADRAMGRCDRMSRAIEDTGHSLPAIEVNEGLPFEIPSRWRPAFIRCSCHSLRNRSYPHGHSALLRASSRHPDHGSPYCHPALLEVVEAGRVESALRPLDTDPSLLFG